ncbi:MAG: radical SAM protein [Treponema sp.]|nr:radical SAM protein [Treponema sp.]
MSTGQIPSGIVLAAINAKWIHPSLALRLLKANLGPLEERCEIIEFALRQPLSEKVAPILAARPRILGISVSIWNHSATVELLKELEKVWQTRAEGRGCGAVPRRPIVVLGGPEVSHLPSGAEIFRYANYVIHGEAEPAFRSLCGNIFAETEPPAADLPEKPLHLYTKPVDPAEIKSAYYLFSDEDLRKKLTYVEASRGCPFNCEFCLSAVKPLSEAAGFEAVREFPLEQFLDGMDDLIRRGARTFKFLDRTFNVNISRAKRIMEFFLDKIEKIEVSQKGNSSGVYIPPFTVHFEMVPSLFPPELRKTIARFPPGTLRVEIGIQTLNPEVSARIKRPSDPERDLETLRFLREKTGAIIHADLIAGLPGEDLTSFGRGFDRLWAALSPEAAGPPHSRSEIQLGILKLLPGAPIARHSESFGMRYSPSPPYEALETAALPARDMDRIKNFARFWELIVNRGLIKEESLLLKTPAKKQRPACSGGDGEVSTFKNFMSLSDALLAHFGRNWGIDKTELRKAVLLHGGIAPP